MNSVGGFLLSPFSLPSKILQSVKVIINNFSKKDYDASYVSRNDVDVPTAKISTEEVVKPDTFDLKRPARPFKNKALRDMSNDEMRNELETLEKLTAEGNGTLLPQMPAASLSTMRQNSALGDIGLGDGVSEFEVGMPTPVVAPPSASEQSARRMQRLQDKLSNPAIAVTNAPPSILKQQTENAMFQRAEDAPITRQEQERRTAVVHDFMK